MKKIKSFVCLLLIGLLFVLCVPAASALSAESIAKGSAPVVMPDFTAGNW